MRASTLALAATVAISAALAVLAASRDDRSGYALFKPLTTFIILLGAWLLILPPQPLYRGVIVLGLALSLAGDVLLLFPRRFAFGLLTFVFANLAYIAAFSANVFIEARQLPWLLPFLAAGALPVAYVWRGLGQLRFAVIIYAAVLAAMAWRAAMRLEASWIPRPSARYAAAGAVLFMASEAILAVRRFKRPFPGSHPIELGLYWAGQFLIAVSVRG